METQNETIPNERWLPVIGYEGIYDVSNLGFVRRAKPGPSTWIGRKLKGSADDHGYMHVELYNGEDRRAVKVHRLVAAAFIGLCPDGKEVNHKDGIKANNAATNLEYVTRSENVLHAFRNGLQVAIHGEAIGSAKLTEENVHAIRRLLGKESNASIAQRFNVTYQTIWNIATGARWAWLEEA